MSSRAGYVLVGGRSSRMGQDKALLKYRGGTLVESVGNAVLAACGTVALVGAEDRYRHLGYRVIPDTYPGEGPLGGIITAMNNSPADWTLVVACDMPGLTTDFLLQLMAAAEASGAVALVPVSPEGKMEPLCAAYHRSARAGLEAAFAEGIRKVATAQEKVGAVTLAVTEVVPFQNVNTPDEWAPYGR